MLCTAVIHQEDEWYVADCPEVGTVSQGKTIEEAIANLREALELFFECASQEEVEQRLHGEVYVTQLEVNVG